MLLSWRKENKTNVVGLQLFFNWMVRAGEAQLMLLRATQRDICITIIYYAGKMAE